MPLVDFPCGLAAQPSSPSPAKDEHKAGKKIPSWKSKSFAQRWLGGLRLVLRAYAGLTSAILLINVGWLLWACKHYGLLGGYGTIQLGDCDVSESLNLWLHLAINVLSTGLLLGSSAFMAAATAPSREEVDLAHRKRKWLSIGLLSPRNLSSVSVQKVLACTLLALTSLPVHLFYNSVIFPSLSGNDYFWAVVTEDFLSGAPFNLSDSNYSWEPAEPVLSSTNMVVLTPTSSQWTQWYQTIQRNASRYERLDNENCIKAYSQKVDTKPAPRRAGILGQERHELCSRVRRLGNCQ